VPVVDAVLYASVVVPVCALSVLVVLILVSPFFRLFCLFRLTQLFINCVKKPLQKRLAVICAVFRRLCVQQHAVEQRSTHRVSVQQHSTAAVTVYVLIRTVRSSTAAAVTVYMFSSTVRSSTAQRSHIYAAVVAS